MPRYTKQVRQIRRATSGRSSARETIRASRRIQRSGGMRRSTRGGPATVAAAQKRIARKGGRSLSSLRASAIRRYVSGERMSASETARALRSLYRKGPGTNRAEYRKRAKTFQAGARAKEELKKIEASGAKIAPSDFTSSENEATSSEMRELLKSIRAQNLRSLGYFERTEKKRLNRRDKRQTRNLRAYSNRKPR